MLSKCFYFILFYFLLFIYLNALYAKDLILILLVNYNRDKVIEWIAKYLLNINLLPYIDTSLKIRFIFKKCILTYK